MAGETLGATYRFQLYALALFGYGLILKTLLAVSVVFFDCRGTERFWIDTGLFWGFSIVLFLMTVFAALPCWLRESAVSLSYAERRWSLIVSGFTIYVGSWLILLFAYLRPESFVGRILGRGLGFSRGDWCL